MILFFQTIFRAIVDSFLYFQDFFYFEILMDVSFKCLFFVPLKSNIHILELFSLLFIPFVYFTEVYYWEIMMEYLLLITVTESVLGY